MTNIIMRREITISTITNIIATNSNIIIKNKHILKSTGTITSTNSIRNHLVSITNIPHIYHTCVSNRSLADLSAVLSPIELIRFLSIDPSSIIMSLTRNIVIISTITFLVTINTIILIPKTIINSMNTIIIIPKTIINTN